MPSLFCIAIWEAYGYNIKKRCVRHCGKRGCAIALLAYSIFSSIVGMVSSGTLTGWVWIAIGVSGVILFANTDKRYRELMQNR